MKRYERMEFAGLPVKDCCCGTVRRAFAEREDSPASVHLLELAEEPVCHYHRKTTEIYVILEGEGHLELDGEMVPVKPMTAVMIKPGCRHRGVGKMKLFNISVPKFDPDDFFLEEADVKEGEVPVH
ncbi:MAG: cupin domain-containing protein [Akkermansiaceae bacterium]|nr:cupin domain-containing protein [Akkermansiaceae bacterium]